MSEYYTQLLVPVSKTCRPAPPSVAQFVERLVEYGYFGDDLAIRFSKVVRVEPRLEKFERGAVLSAVTEIVARAEAADEYVVFLSSTSLPRRSLLELGSMDKDGCWRPWISDYCLDVDVHVRNSLVQVCDNAEGEDTFGSDAVGLSRHPECRELIPVPSAGCAMAWIRVTPGTFLYPRIKNGSLELLDNNAAAIVRQLFAGDFVQACEWG